MHQTGIFMIPQNDQVNISASSRHWKRFPSTRTSSQSFKRRWGLFPIFVHLRFSASHTISSLNTRLPSSTSETSWRPSKRRSSPWTKKRALGSVFLMIMIKMMIMMMMMMIMVLFLRIMEFQFRCLPFSGKNWINFERKTSKFRDPEHLLSLDQRNGRAILNLFEKPCFVKFVHNHQPDCAPYIKTFQFLREKTFLAGGFHLWHLRKQSTKMNLNFKLLPPIPKPSLTFIEHIVTKVHNATGKLSSFSIYCKNILVCIQYIHTYTIDTYTIDIYIELSCKIVTIKVR